METKKRERGNKRQHQQEQTEKGGEKIQRITNCLAFNNFIKMCSQLIYQDLKKFYRDH